MRGDQAGGPRLLLTELWVFMNIATPRDQLALDLRGAQTNFLFEVGHDRLRMRRWRPNRRNEYERKYERAKQA